MRTSAARMKPAVHTYANPGQSTEPSCGRCGGVAAKSCKDCTPSSWSFFLCDECDIQLHTSGIFHNRSRMHPLTKGLRPIPPLAQTWRLSECFDCGSSLHNSACTNLSGLCVAVWTLRSGVAIVTVQRVKCFSCFSCNYVNGESACEFGYISAAPDTWFASDLHMAWHCLRPAVLAYRYLLGLTLSLK